MGNIVYIIKRLKTMDKKAMQEKINSIHLKTGKSKFSIFMDMQKCARKYGAGYMDYDLYEMYNLTDEQRNTYLTRGRNNELVTKYCDKSVLHYFENKDEFNEKFEKYIKRDWIKVNTASKEKVMEFMEKHHTFMIKPIGGGCGKGIEKVKIKQDTSLEELYDYLLQDNKNVILEEVIMQHSEVSKIYPDAINTARIVTIITGKDGVSLLTIPKEERNHQELEVHIVATYFRIGNGGRCVDNFNSGGMVAPIDKNTGIVTQVALDKQKNLYEKHPQTGSAIKGFQFPDWQQALELCRQAAKEIPEMGYIGWDVAFTPNGPLFVEANEFPGHDIYQLPEHTPNKIGMMSEFDFIKKK